MPGHLTRRKGTLCDIDGVLCRRGVYQHVKQHETQQARCPDWQRPLWSFVPLTVRLLLMSTVGTTEV